MGKLVPNWRWLVWPILLLLIGLLLFVEQQISTAQNNTLTPTFSLPSGRYDEDIRLEIRSPHPDAVTYFSLDGRLPDPVNGTLYEEPLNLTADPEQVVVVRAQSYFPSGESGQVASATYFMGLDTKLPLLSIIIDPDDFGGPERGIYANHEERGRDWERPVDITFASDQDDGGFQSGGGMRIHGGWTRYFYDKKSFRLYFREEYGSSKLNYPIFGDEGQIAFDSLILHNSDKDLLLFKNRLVEHLTEQMAGYRSRSRPALLFINGTPWGIYNIRERIDERFLAENFGVPGADISDTPNNIEMQSAEQKAVDTVHWEHFIQFVQDNDLSDPENYAYLKTQIDLPNFIDYYLLQMYIANSDWPHHNVHQFRPRTQGGRWEWIVWDNDFAFGEVGQQMVDHVLNSDHPLGERMEILLNKLLANPDFRNLFLTRAADLLNTTLSTENVLANMEEFISELDADIEIERSRWDISDSWPEATAHMRDFAQRRPDIMRQHFVESLNLQGTSRVRFEQSTDLPGWIVINETAPQQLPWEGVFFQGTTINVRAVPPVGQKFAGWVTDPELNLGSSAMVSILVEGDMNLAPAFVPIVDDGPRPFDVTIDQVSINDSGQIEGDWFEFRINHPGELNLAGWRFSDNDSLTANDEGSLIFKGDPLWKNLPEGTVVRVIASETERNKQTYPVDGWQGDVLIVYVGNGRIDIDSDPWFDLGPRDNLVIFAPGETTNSSDDVAIDFWSNNLAVTASDYGLPPNRTR